MRVTETEGFRGGETVNETNKVPPIANTVAFGEATDQNLFRPTPQILSHHMTHIPKRKTEMISKR